MDGCHRVIKALALGNTHISARVLIELPEPDDQEPHLDEETSQSVAWKYRDMVEVVRAFLSTRRGLSTGLGTLSTVSERRLFLRQVAVDI